MSTRSVIARKTATGFTGVYHHWDGYPAGLGAQLFELRNGHFRGDTESMLRYLIDDHPEGWSTICGANFLFPPDARPDRNLEPCAECCNPTWAHYRQYYAGRSRPDSPLTYWERCGRPVPPKGDDVLVLGHQVKLPDKEAAHGPETGGRQPEKPFTEVDSAEAGCEYAYVFDGEAMTILSSFRPDGAKMIGMFGMGDPDSAWHAIARVDLNSPEPDWDAIKNEPIMDAGRSVSL